MDKNKFDYMEALVLYKEEDKLKVCIEKIVREFRVDGFYDDDIYSYIKKVVMDVMLKDEFDRWKEIKKLMKG